MFASLHVGLMSPSFVSTNDTYFSSYTEVGVLVVGCVLHVDDEKTGWDDAHRPMARAKASTSCRMVAYSLAQRLNKRKTPHGGLWS